MLYRKGEFCTAKAEGKEIGQNYLFKAKDIPFLERSIALLREGRPLGQAEKCNSWSNCRHGESLRPQIIQACT